MKKFNFFLTGYREVLVKYSLLLRMQESPFAHAVTEMTNGFILQIFILQILLFVECSLDDNA